MDGSTSRMRKAGLLLGAAVLLAGCAGVRQPPTWRARAVGGRARALAAASALLLAAAACSGSPSAAPEATAPTAAPFGQFGGRAVLGISNGTSLAVSLVVNGRVVGTAEPGVGLAPIPIDALPPLPWTVEARAPSGRVLTSMEVARGSISTDGTQSTGPFGRVDLSCGRITIFAGYFSPSGPVPPAPAGSPGDCAP
jgi:hypothetical protein